MVKLKIDNIEVEVAPDTSILDAARAVQINIPTLCKHPDVDPSAGCGMCIVKVGGRIMRSCCTPVSEGMEVITNDEELREIRKMVLKLILSNHPNDCLNCSRNSQCELQDITAEVGIDQNEIVKLVAQEPKDDTTGAIVMDPAKCIVCGRCVNICQNVFLENEMVRSIECGMATNKGRNFIVTGYLGARKLLVHDESDSQAWKMQSTDVKRIIWAPHHSILNKDILNYSNFLDIADDMLSLAHEYNGRVQFAFKPHPGLKPKLYDHPEWGKERTDRYYAEWNNMPNSILAEGSYERLFRSSDAMIHDCSSFTVEYLYTGNPVMYVTKDDHLDYLNDFGKACFDVHYKGKSISDIRSFIDRVVMDGQDSMKTIRSEFVNKNLMFDDMCTPEQIIVNNMKNVCVYGK